MYTLTVEKRTKADSIPALRAAGKIPAVFYGPKEPSTSVSMSLVDFTKVWKKAGESSIVILKEGSNEHEVLIHDVDMHPVTEAARHADFYVIEKGKKLTVDVPLVFTGVAPAVKDKGGILIKVLHTVKIQALPKDLPHELKADISTLVEFSSTIHARDIVLPSGVELAISGDDIVASVSEAKEEIEEAPVAVDMSTIEVAKKGKEAKEGEEGAEGGAEATDEKKAK